MDVYFVKYGIWNISRYDPARQAELCEAGYSPLTAAVLCARGCDSPEAARRYLATDAPLCDPMALKDMDRAVQRVRRALERGEHIAVFGDYDVDGITATCLLTDFLRSLGGNVTPYIPSRLEEGYGLNESALRSLQSRGVELIITVDCGITACEEAELCRALGMDLVITDHHECKDVLPAAAAVVDPHRKDDTYPNPMLAGVGVAFKLACAVSGTPEALLERYGILVCLGTVADVIPLRGESRAMVARGLKLLGEDPGVGLAALIEDCGTTNQPITANFIGYTLAPRINAAGRIGRVDVAMELFLTDNAMRAAELANQLCRMNRQRQTIELSIYQDAVSRLQAAEPPAIVLAGEDWHQGVVGIVASRLAEEYACPTFLICMDGDKGKASSRSYGGLNLFRTLDELSYLLESYGGHELAAGFTISRGRIDDFRQAVEEISLRHCASGIRQAALDVDCRIEPELLTLQNIDALEELEPCGAGCPKPVFAMSGLRVEQLTPVGGGKHLRMRLKKNDTEFCAMFFSNTDRTASVAEGDVIEVAFAPQVNEYRGVRSVQLNVVDLRQEAPVRELAQQDQQAYARFREGQPLAPEERTAALPERPDFVALWKYLEHFAENGVLEESADCLARKLSRFAGREFRPLRVQICLDVFEELGLLTVLRRLRTLTITLSAGGKRVDLETSRILNALRRH